MTWVRRPGLHLLSTLAWAEVHGVIARIQRERALAEALVRSAREALRWGPWRRTYASPDWDVVHDLATRWPLRGPDLWHLAAAKGLRRDLPELLILSFDERLVTAARGEGLVLPGATR